MKKCLIQAVIALLLNLVLQSTSLNCKEGDLQLDHNSTKVPLVMICVQGQWGYVCGREQPAVSPWELENVGVACQQLGLIRASDVQIPSLVERISDTLPVHYRFVYCTGVERRLIDCAHGESPNNDLIACKEMGKYTYGAVACSEEPAVCVAGEVKIIKNTLLICSQGEWYTLCGDTDSWTQAQARVACRQMGLNPIGAKALHTSKENMKRLSVVFHCEGDEDSLLDCSSSIIQCVSSGTSNFIATVECGDPINPPQNLTATLDNHMITISWDYDENDAMFQITCTDNQISSSITANGTTEAIFRLPPDTQYECCVTAVTLSGESKSVCKEITMDPKNPPENVSATTDNQMIFVSWSHDSTSSSAVFMITCSNEQITFSTTVNGTMEATLYGIKLSPDTQYECCVTAVTLSGESERVCDGITIAKSSTSLMLDTTAILNLNTLVKEETFVLASKPVGGVTSSSSTEMSSCTFSSTATDHSASSYTSPVVPWSVGLLIGIFIGVAAIIIIWIGQVVYRKRKEYSKPEAREMSGNAVSNPIYGFNNKPEDSNQPFSSETKVLYEPVYTDADSPYSVAQDDTMYSLAVSGECCNMEQQEYSEVKVNDCEDLYHELSNVCTD